MNSHVDGGDVGPADGFDHFAVEVSLFQHSYSLCHRVAQEIGRSDKLEEYEMLDRNDQGSEEVQHDAESPCVEETDASSYVLPVTFGQVVGDERNGKAQAFINKDKRGNGVPEDEEQIFYYPIDPHSQAIRHRTFQQ